MNKIFQRGFLSIIFIIGTAFSAHAESPRYDGLYYVKLRNFTMYFRFFTDGRVINANVPGKPDNTVKEWFDVTFNENHGTFTMDGYDIKFFIESEDGIVEYIGKLNRHFDKKGRIKTENLQVDMHSLINNHKASIKLIFMAGV